MKKIFLALCLCILLGSPCFAEGDVLPSPQERLAMKIDTDTDIMGARLGPALYALAARADMDIIVNSKLEGTVIARLTGKTVLDAFELLARANNFNWVVEGNTIIVTPAEIGSLTRSFVVPHGDLEYAKKQLSTFVPGNKIVINPEYGTITVNGTPLILSQVEEKLKENLAPVDQIFIQAQMIEINRSEGENLGMGYSWESYTGTWPPVYAVTLNAKATFSRGKLLSRPSLTTFNGRTAKISMGEKVPVFTANNVSGGTTSTTVDYKDVGMFLTVTPRINTNPTSGEKTVTLNVKPSVSAITKWVTAGLNKAPQIATREAETTVRVPSGATLVIGGLIKEEDVRNLEGIPGLMKIPILGELFKSHSNTKEKSEVFILITPTILDTSGKPIAGSVSVSTPTPDKNREGNK